jgi:hypothetical protein
MPDLTPRELAALGALAEVLVPADETPGADAAWAQAFVMRRVSDHPAERAEYAALAAHVDSLAGAGGFAELPVARREQLVRDRHSSLADAADLSRDERELRQTMRDLITAFLVADGFDVRGDPYALGSARPGRDRRLVSTAEFSTADAVPDSIIDRRIATGVGTGTYARVWRAVGYPYAPGDVPERSADVTLAPHELVALRFKRHP